MHADDPIEAMADDVRTACGLWRTALQTAGRTGIKGFEDTSPKLADAVEEKLNKLLAKVGPCRGRV